MLLRGSRRGLRARRQGAARDGARQRDRGRSDALREGDRVAAVLAAEGALPLRVEVLQPPLGKREGVRRERRRLPSQEPPRSRPVRRVRGRTQREVACRLRAHQLHLAQQVQGAHDEDVPRRLRGDGVPPGRALRLRRVAGGEVGQAGLRPRRRQLLLRRARLARPGPRRGSPRQQRRHTRGPQSPRRDPAQVPGGEPIGGPPSLVPAIVARPRATVEPTIRRDMPDDLVAAIDAAAGRRRAGPRGPSGGPPPPLGPGPPARRRGGPSVAGACPTARPATCSPGASRPASATGAAST